MASDRKNALVVLGPTASGKTMLGVALARRFGGEIVSVDSRQVYRGLNIGSGKDLEEYSAGGKTVPYHLIDVVDLNNEFNLFRFQRSFVDAFAEIEKRSALPVVVGGTGLYLESVLNGYRLVEAPEDPALREELSVLPDDALFERLRALKDSLHNTTDTGNRARLIRAIEIETYAKTHTAEAMPPVRALILGIRWEREELHRRIEKRLRERVRAGMIEEVEGLVAKGVRKETLRFLGLEYRFVTDYLDGAIKNKNDLIQKLNSAIRNFAKRQETWFRRMERNGTEIHWIDRADPDAAHAIAARHFYERSDSTLS